VAISQQKYTLKMSKPTKCLWRDGGFVKAKNLKLCDRLVIGQWGHGLAKT